MGTPVLVEPYITDGRRLVEGLDAAGFEIDAAFWHYWPDSAEWRLVIASPVVEMKGAMAAYHRIRTILEQITPPLAISMGDLSLEPTNALIVEPLRRVVAPFAARSAERRAWAGIAGGYILDDYVYRVR